MLMIMTIKHVKILFNVSSFGTEVGDCLTTL